MQFLVSIEFTGPELSSEELEALREAEADRARQLAELGVLVKLWRTPDRWANWGVWSAPDTITLFEYIDSLPLRRYATVTTYPLAPHPSDPAGRF